MRETSTHNFYVSDYMIPGKEHIQSYVNHLVRVNHEEKITFVPINKNGSTHLRSFINFPHNKEEDFPGFFDLNDRCVDNYKKAMEVCTRDDYVNLIILREPASRLASSITHDIVVHAQNRNDPLPFKGQVNLKRVADMFLEDFKSFDLGKFLLSEHEAGLVIPPPEECAYHGRIQFNDAVVEILNLPNTIVFHVDDDLSDNILYFLEVHRPHLYKKIIDENLQKWIEHHRGYEEEPTREQIHEILSKTQLNTRHSNSYEFIYYTLMPYLTDPRIQPNKIYDDYQKFYRIDIEMYRRFDSSRYFRRP